MRLELVKSRGGKMAQDDPKGQMALVTGGSGLLGRHLVSALNSRGIKVRVLDLTSPPEETGPVEFVKGDVSDAGTVSDACRGCAVAFHLAGRMPQARLSSEGFWRVNVGGTKNVTEGCLRHNVPALIFASTIEIYGAQKDFPIREESPKLFTGIYSRNKWECEQMLLDYRKNHGLKVSFMRMPMIMGAGFYHERAALSMMRRVHGGKPLPLPGGPDIPFTIVAASDVADAFIAAFEKKEADGEAFNISAGPAEPTREFFSRFIKAVGSSSQISQIPHWIMPPIVYLAVKFDISLPMTDTPAELLPFSLTGGDYDISKARRILGYEPKKDALSALVETYRWVLEQNLI
jgi:nucleoside-diphosphate-sugar epimerase